jgi:predicted  nucleic acid-binding Zn-ribbon protein
MNETEGGFMESAIRNLLRLQALDQKIKSLGKKPTKSQLERRKDLAESLPSYVGSTYERIRGSRHPAVVRCDDGYCEACQMQVPPYLAQRVEVKHEIEVCEHCGRLLYADVSSRTLSITAA